MGERVDQTRRNFLRGKRLSTTGAIRLPWLKSEHDLLEHCNQCGDCITACPENIIVLGAGGFPEVKFDRGECTFCQQCVQSCRLPLFTDLEHDPAWQLDINIKETCLAFNRVYCQSCQDCCEPQAIGFSYLSSSIPQPVISQADCNACGACISVCPQAAIELTMPQAEPGKAMARCK